MIRLVVRRSTIERVVGLWNAARRWAPAFLLMLVIFALSSRTPSELPYFGRADAVVKKTGHALGYGLLSLAFWRGLRWEPRSGKWAWLLATLYAATDEYHQTLVPGRHPSITDVLCFDAVGAGLGLLLRSLITGRRQGHRA